MGTGAAMHGLRSMMAWWLAAGLTALAGGCAPVAPRGAAPATVTIYHVGDLHEHTANLPRIAAFVKDRKRQEPNVLFLDAGDRFNKGETPMMYTRGEAAMALAGACRFDAAAIGNHDLSFGADRLGRLADRFQVPLTAANARWPAAYRPAVAAPYRVFRLDGVTVAVVAAASEIMNHRSDDLVEVQPAEAALPRAVREARRQADIVILLTHAPDPRDEEVARTVRGVDAIIGGHSHAVFRKTTREPTSGTVIHKAGSMGRFIGEMTIAWDGRRVAEVRTRIIDVTPAMPEDAEVLAVRRKYLDALPEKAAIARVPRDLPAAELTSWIAEAVRVEAGADVVVASAKMAKLGLPAGDFTAGSLEAIPPLEVVCMDLPGAAALDGLLAEVRRSVKDARVFGPLPPSGKSPIRVAYPCVEQDEMIDPNACGLTGRAVSRIERLRDRSLWQIVVAHARRVGSLAAPAAQPDRRDGT